MELILSMLLLFVVTVNECFAYSSGDREILTQDEHINKYMEYLWCPTKLLGTMCPENSLTYYYKCCGDLNNECCYHIRTWVLVGGIAIPLLVLVAVIISLIKKFCFTPRQRYTPGRQQ